MPIVNRRPGFEWDCPVCLCENYTRKPSFIIEFDNEDDMTEARKHLSQEVLDQIRSEHLNDFRLYCDPKFIICKYCRSEFNTGDDEVTDGPEPIIPRPGQVSETVPPVESEPTGTGTE